MCCRSVLLRSYCSCLTHANFCFSPVSVEGIAATPFPDNPRYFMVAIQGPRETPYEGLTWLHDADGGSAADVRVCCALGGVFRLELFLPADYPMAPPKVRFLTKVYHPNVDKVGRICLDVLKDKWSPALQIRTVLLSIQVSVLAVDGEMPAPNNNKPHPPPPFLALPCVCYGSSCVCCQCLLSAPNPDDPLDTQVSEMWTSNEAEAHRIGSYTPGGCCVRVCCISQCMCINAVPNNAVRADSPAMDQEVRHNKIGAACAHLGVGSCPKCLVFPKRVVLLSGSPKHTNYTTQRFSTVLLYRQRSWLSPRL